MSGQPDRDRTSVRPFLIERGDDGAFRLLRRETRYNSQNYPIVTAMAVGDAFKSAAAARAFAKSEFGAETRQFAVK